MCSTDAAQQLCLACPALTCPIFTLLSRPLVFPQGVSLSSFSCHRSFHPSRFSTSDCSSPIAVPLPNAGARLMRVRDAYPRVKCLQASCGPVRPSKIRPPGLTRAASSHHPALRRLPTQCRQIVSGMSGNACGGAGRGGADPTAVRVRLVGVGEMLCWGWATS